LHLILAHITTIRVVRELPALRAARVLIWVLLPYPLLEIVLRQDQFGTERAAFLELPETLPEPVIVPGRGILTVC
jgi:hypothetical protein